MALREEIIMRCKLRPDSWLPAALLAAFVSVAFLGACMGGAGPGARKSPMDADDGMNVFFRDVSLESLSDQALPRYPDSDAGESTKIARDFPDAPPQVPHTVEDMYPITRRDNECLNCHHPDNALGKEDSPLLDSHFEAPVMGKGAAQDPMIWVVKDYRKIQDVMGGRYNCNMCHTPQATNVATPKNGFRPPRRAR